MHLISVPTRVTGTTSTILDHIISSDSSIASNFTVVLNYDVSHHDMLHSELVVLTSA